MSTPQELIDYVTQDNVRLTDLIAQKDQQKLEIDAAIAERQANIDYFNTQKTQCDADIATYNSDISKNNEIITILQGQ